MQNKQQILATLRCFRPSGTIQISKENALTHVGIIGATGSGKTSSVVNPILQQFIGYRSTDVANKLGLVVIDPKGDVVHKIRRFADEARRSEDLIILGEGSYLPIFKDLTRLDAVPRTAARLFAASSMGMGPYNTYWEESRRGFLESALCLLLCNGSPIRYAEAVAFFNACWLSSKREPIVDVQLEKARSLINSGRLTESTRNRLLLAVEDVEMWFRLDHRTRENHRSSILAGLRPFWDTAAQQIFKEEGGTFTCAEALTGKILVASINAQVSPDLASLVFRLAKRDFFYNVHSRVSANLNRDRLVFLIIDDYASAFPEPAFVDDLATCRSRGAGVVLATQSLSAVDERIGRDMREALLANIGSMFYLANRDRATDLDALLRLGYQSGPPQPFDRDVKRIEVMDHPQGAHVCELGALGRLAPHQAYISLNSGNPQRQPVLLEPLFTEIPPAHSPEPQPDDLALEVSRLRAAAGGRRQKSPAALKKLVCEIMRERGHPRLLTTAIVEGLWKLCETKQSQTQLLENLGKHARIENIGALPNCWLAGLGALTKRHGDLFIGVTGVQIVGGLLCFESGNPGRFGDLHAAVHMWIYPSLFRRPKKP